MTIATKIFGGITEDVTRHIRLDSEFYCASSYNLHPIDLGAGCSFTVPVSGQRREGDIRRLHIEHSDRYVAIYRSHYKDGGRKKISEEGIILVDFTAFPGSRLFADLVGDVSAFSYRCSKNRCDYSLQYMFDDRSEVNLSHFSETDIGRRLITDMREIGELGSDWDEDVTGFRTINGYLESLYHLMRFLFL